MLLILFTHKVSTRLVFFAEGIRTKGPVRSFTGLQGERGQPRSDAHLQMSNDAEVLGPLQAAGGRGAEFVRAADQQVTCGGVAAAFRAHACKLWELCPDGTQQGCGDKRHFSAKHLPALFLNENKHNKKTEKRRFSFN